MNGGFFTVKDKTRKNCSTEIPNEGNPSQYSGAQLSGIAVGNVGNTAKSYVEEKFHGERGHGFAVERANDQHDRFSGKNARIVGDNNARDGADRIVNGTNIQSKYCSTGAKCVQECFRDGKFRYYNPDGSPMQIEVPSDKYDDAIRAMQSRIDRGQVRGVKNAKEIIRRGHYTYEQTKNIAKAGTIDSLKYDAQSGLIIGAYAGGISAAITFAVASWNGKSFEDALEDSVKAGLQVGGISFASSILVGQMTKAGVNSLLVAPSEAIVSALGPRASATLVNAFRSGSNIYGAAAMNSAAKLLRGNAVTGIATVVVMSAGDVVNIFRGRISAAQLFKNLVNTTAGVAGGIAGWSGGAMAGVAVGSVVPVVGTTIGGIVGGLFGAFAGGSAASKVSQAVTDEIIEDDSREMFRILESEFQIAARDFILNETEGGKVADSLKDKLDGSTLKDMYASNDRRDFARDLIDSRAEPVVRSRPKIYLPETSDYVHGLREVLEKSA